MTVTARRPTAVQEVQVTADWCPRVDPARHPAGAPPHVIASYPSRGATVAPGPITLSVTFDQPMSCSWVTDYLSRGDEPCRPEAVWAVPDRRTWLMDCRLPSNTTFRIRIGDDRGSGFVGLSGMPAGAYDMAFNVSDGRPVGSQVERTVIGEPEAPPPSRGGYVLCKDDEESGGERCRHLRAWPEDGTAEAEAAPASAQQ